MHADNTLLGYASSPDKHLSRGQKQVGLRQTDHGFSGLVQLRNAFCWNIRHLMSSTLCSHIRAQSATPVREAHSPKLRHGATCQGQVEAFHGVRFAIHTQQQIPTTMNSSNLCSPALRGEESGMPRSGTNSGAEGLTWRTRGMPSSLTRRGYETN